MAVLHSISLSPSVTSNCLPLPRRSAGHSLGTFKFGDGASAAVMSVLERCPPEHLGGVRCNIAFTHKSGRAHVGRGLHSFPFQLNLSLFFVLVSYTSQSNP